MPEEKLREAAEKEVSRINEIMSGLKVVKESKETGEFLILIQAYHKDSNHFLEKGKNLEAFEAAIIVWAYVDAGLRLGIFSVEEKHRKLFTV